MLYLIISLVVIVLTARFLSKHAFPPLGTISLVTGGVKSGKSSFGVWYCVTTHFTNLLYVWFYNLFHRKKKKEIPYLYSNIPLKYKWCRKLTLDLIMRKVRFAYGSIVYVNEASLLADSKMYKDDEINESLMLFCKLFGHELGPHSFLLWDTQSLEDCHHAPVRCMSEYIYLSGKKRIPFGMLVDYRRMKLSPGKMSVDVNVFEGRDIVESPSVYICSLVWKIFDAYCFSCLTDDLPVSSEEYEKGSLKCSEILTLSRTRRALLNVKNKEKKVEVLSEDESKEILHI